MENLNGRAPWEDPGVDGENKNGLRETGLEGVNWIQLAQ